MFQLLDAHRCVLTFSSFFCRALLYYCGLVIHSTYMDFFIVGEKTVVNGNGIREGRSFDLSSQINYGLVTVYMFWMLIII